jgi:hypothetical protein
VREKIGYVYFGIVIMYFEERERERERERVMEVGEGNR